VLQPSPVEDRFETWTRWNAVIMLGSLGLAWLLGRAWPVAAAGFASLAAFTLANRGAWTPAGRFGWANAVTTLRAVLVWTLAAYLGAAPAGVLAAIVFAVFALDGLDGYLAKRHGTASKFGALFDMETDAYFVLTAELVLVERGDFGAWILLTGVLRYFYVVVRATVPARRPDVPRSRLGRAAFVLLALGLFFAFALPGVFGHAAAIVGTLAVTLSFAVSFYDSYAPTPRR
jgi:phosphatidylglycerophosphate synthase